MYGTSNSRIVRRPANILQKQEAPKKKATVKKSIVGTIPDSEDALQRNIVAKFRAHGAFVILTDAVGPAIKFISDPKRKMGFISWSKARGWEKGVPDLIIVWKDSILFLELKFGKTGRLSDEQKAYRERVISAGYEYACWKTMTECEEWIVKKLNKD